MPSATTPVALIPPPPQPDRALTPTPTPQLGAASLQTLLEQVAGAGCWTYDVMPPRLSWSDALATLLQWPPAVSPGWVQALDFFAPESRSAMADALHACMSRAQPFDQEVMALTAKGQRLKVRAVGRAECDDNGQLLRVQGLLQNRSLLTLDEKNARGTAMQLSSTLAST